ncbi:MSMEG_0570 family nitrogen starvation response protein [Exilibacterium tricleocarpae]|uniref:MSMEG_0570 family nitrogen starvation response protein n=1 Tax=Exilibacterium tricleocarpae TaxID=2591008 RepID=A0A545U9Z3_9GAMM|nr:MSMEG_0570 family nitrogen starvation response protein [Exilibacterium tricleocarpae]TQV86286.1 MSMEG_0570 family nitrogen starvation response protein [Exilibacterium tricleocarpae]
MPEVYFNIEWPDGSQESCYSPSTVIKDHLQEGEEYSMQQFLLLVRQGLNEASERVRQKYGYACSSAIDQLHSITHTAAGFGTQQKLKVRVKKIVSTG